MENPIKINDIEVYYERHNKTASQAVILIAGFSCDHVFWDSIIKPLTKKYEVIVFDNRGIGQTDAPDSTYSIEQMANDTMQLIKQLGISKPIIVGQSMGSAIAQKMAQKYGEEIKKIILINTFSSINKAPELAFEFTGELQKKNASLSDRVKSIAPWVYSSEFLSQPNQLDQLIQFAEKNPYPQTIVGYERQLEALKNFDSHPWLNEITLPTLIIAAEEDIIAPLKSAVNVAKGIGNKAKLSIIPGGHASPIEQAEKVSDLILTFIDE